MDIITRGSRGKTDLRIIQGTLRARQETYVWRRGREPTDIRRGERVYFVGSTGVYGYALYKSYEYRKGQNVEGEVQEGNAIIVEGPFTRLEPPIILPSPLLRPWGWRYVKGEIKQLLR